MMDNCIHCLATQVRRHPGEVLPPQDEGDQPHRLMRAGGGLSPSATPPTPRQHVAVMIWHLHDVAP